jgi:glyoxylase-like metal-dependent hydrolase (beta-lactamase superfamily II)
VGRTDLPGGDSKLLKQSIERLSELDIEYVLPGHSIEFGAMIKGVNNVKQNFASVRLNYFPVL